MTRSWFVFCHQSRRYKGLKEGELPTCESLKDTIARALPFWNEVIVPEIKAGKNVLIAAHGNSLRGIVKHLEGEFHMILPTHTHLTGCKFDHEAFTFPVDPASNNSPCSYTEEKATS